MPPVRPGDGVQPSAVRADRLPLPAAQDQAMTTMTLTARPAAARLRPLHVSLRLEYFLTVPLTRCASW
jgi:hypothetical protein